MAFLSAYPDAHARASSQQQQLDEGRRPGAAAAQGHAAARLRAEHAAPDHAARLALQLEAARRLPQRLPVRPHRLGPAQQVGSPFLDVDGLPAAAQRDDGRLRQGHREDPGLHRRRPVRPHAVRDQLPVHLPGQGDREQGPHGPDRAAHEPDRRRAVPVVLGGPHLHLLGHPHPHCGAGTPSRSAPSSSTRARTTSTRSTCRPTCPATPTTRTAASSSPTAATGGTGIALANTALGLFTNYAEIGERSYTEYRAWALDLFAQDSWKVKDNLTFEYGIRWAIWQPWYANWNNMAVFDPRYYDAAKAAVVDPKGGYIVSGDPYNGVVLPGDGWPDGAKGTSGSPPAAQYDRLFRGLPRGLQRDPLGRPRAADRRRLVGEPEDRGPRRAPGSSTTASRSTTARCSAATRPSRSSRASATASRTTPPAPRCRGPSRSS